ncbi:MAG: hypothetical protein JXB05_13040, partial [Myxococcaceae bacterium]|nr:hypothetical protein [Myxococcaceae bacterium]
MSVSKTGGSGPSNNTRSREREEPKAAPKPADPPKVEKENPTQAQQPGTKPRNAPASNTVKPPSDGFEAKTTSSTQRSQQQALLGSTTASETPETTQPGALEKIGLTADDVIRAGADAAPHLEKAAQAAIQGRYEEALGHLGDAATSSPDIAEKALKGLAEKLPEGVAKTLLTDDQVVHELLTNKEAHASVGKLLQNPADLGAVRELLGNDSLRDATLTALGTDPGVQAQLEQIGLTPQDLVQAGQAAPKLIDAFEKLQAGDVKGALTDFQSAVQAAPDLAAKLGQKLLDKVPQ